MSKTQKEEEKPLTEEQAAKRAAGIAASAERRKARSTEKGAAKEQGNTLGTSVLVPADRDSVTVPGAVDYASMDTVTFHAAAVAAVDELHGLSDQCGLVVYTKILPALTNAKRLFDAGEEVNGCHGIEEYVISLGLKPARVRKWKQRAAERDLLKQVKVLTGGTAKPDKPKPLAYTRKQKERLLNAASIIGSELIPAYENGHDISEPIAELKKIAFDSEELASIVDVPEKRENPRALSLARHVKKLFTEHFTVRQDIQNVEVEPQRFVHGVFLEGKNGGDGTSPIDTLMDRVKAIIEELDPATVAAERQAKAEAEAARIQQRKDDCVVWLRELLNKGAVLKRHALRAGCETGFNRPTIQEAAKKLDVRVDGIGRVCLWSLHKPEPEASSMPVPAITADANQPCWTP
jgi:hypothetical protein